jgi:hypothetical protein
MRVFIGWSGPRSKLLAEALRDWLGKVIQACEPWLSSKDLQAGEAWDPELVAKLKEARVGILCLTSDNRDSAAIHYEAGAMTIAIDEERKYVCPYLLDIAAADLNWPLDRFQAVKANAAETPKLLDTVNAALGEKRLSQAQLNEAFSVWWPKLDEQISKIPQTTKPVPKRSQAEMLEEILLRVRSLSVEITDLRMLDPRRESRMKQAMRRVLSTGATLGDLARFGFSDEAVRDLKLDVADDLRSTSEEPEK